jgi:hypothetical protein
MATEKRIIPDTGSEEVRLIRTQHNELLEVVEALLAAATGAADFAAFKTAATAVVTTDLRELIASREPPAMPSID